MTNTKYEIRVSRKARTQFAEHTNFLAESSITAAIDLYDVFNECIDRIKTNPQMYQFADEMDAPGIPEKEYRRCIFKKNYKIMYRLAGETIFVTAVLDSRADNTWSISSEPDQD